MRKSGLRAEDGNNYRASPLAGHLLALSLFIILLAFFILLNAMSFFEQKRTTRTIEAIQTVFAREGGHPGFVPSEERDSQLTLDPTAGEGSASSRAKNLFHTLLPGYRIDTDEKNSIVHLRVPFTDIEALALLVSSQSPVDTKETERRKEHARKFFPALVSLIGAEGDAARFSIEIIRNLPSRPGKASNEQPDLLQKEAERLALVLERLGQAGLPAGALSGGFAEGDGKTADIYFRPFPAHLPADETGR